MDNFEKIGDKLRKTRKNVGMTAKELGNKIGLSEDMVCKIERGEKKLQPKYRNKLYNIFGTDIFDNLSDNTILMSEINSLKHILISYNLTDYELKYIKLKLEQHYCPLNNKIYIEDELSKMKFYMEKKPDINNVLKTAISFLDFMLQDKSFYQITEADLHTIISSLNSTELVNSNIIPVYNSSTFFPYIDNIYRNYTTDYYYLPKSLANDKYDYIGLQVSNFILETATPKYKPLDIIILRISTELYNGSDILLANKQGMFIKNLKIEKDNIFLSNPCELNPCIQKYNLVKFKEMINSFELTLVGTIVEISVSEKSSYDYATHKYYFPPKFLKEFKGR